MNSITQAEQELQRERQIKLLMLGDSATGKTCILQKFTEGTFNSSFITTIGIDFRSKTMLYKGAMKKVVIWDTAGQERFRNITRAYYRGSMGMLLVYDITNRTTFNNITNWIKEIKSNTSDDLEIVLIGNKSDLIDKRQVSTDEGQSLADSQRIHFLETSAKTGDNIKEAFEYLFNLVCASMEKKIMQFEKTIGIVPITPPASCDGRRNGCSCNSN
jgi:Ras-related protein Rab-8A